MSRKPAEPVVHKGNRVTIFRCSCGWESKPHSGEGAREATLVEWRAHKEEVKKASS